MTDQMYTTILSQFCEAVGLQEPEKLQATGTLVIDDFNVALSYHSMIAPDKLNIEVDLGTVPVERERDAYRAMLEMNLVTSQWQTGQIGIYGSSGHAVFSVHMPLAPHTTGQDLATTLDHVIHQAQCVRKAVNGAPE